MEIKKVHHPTRLNPVYQVTHTAGDYQAANTTLHRINLPEHADDCYWKNHQQTYTNQERTLPTTSISKQ